MANSVNFRLPLTPDSFTASERGKEERDDLLRIWENSRRRRLYSPLDPRGRGSEGLSIVLGKALACRRMSDMLKSARLRAERPVPFPASPGPASRCQSAIGSLRPLSRRRLLQQAASGFGAVALSALLSEDGFATTVAGQNGSGRRAAEPFSGEGEARHFPVHGRRPVAGRHVRPETAARSGARTALQNEGATHAVRQRGDHAEVAVEIQKARGQRHPGQRPFAEHRPLCRRIVRRAVDDVAILGTHERQLFSAHGAGPAGTSQHGRLGDLRPRQRVAEFARICRAQRRLDSAGGRRLFSQRFLAGNISGLHFPPRRKAGRRPGQSRRLERNAAAQARPDADARCSVAGKVGAQRRDRSGHP